jgi:hypothetical protein
MGCGTFCCRLLVRLCEDEREPSVGGSTPKGFVDKAPDGLCINLDRETHRCLIWDKRPRICREYDCNYDYLLQVAIRLGVKNIAQLSKDSLQVRIAQEDFIKIPVCGCEQGTKNKEEENG